MSWQTPLSQRSLGARVLAAILALALGVLFVLTQYPVVPSRSLATSTIFLFLIYGLLLVFRPQWLESWGTKIDTKIQKVFSKLLSPFQ